MCVCVCVCVCVCAPYVYLHPRLNFDDICSMKCQV